MLDKLWLAFWSLVTGGLVAVVICIVRDEIRARRARKERGSVPPS